MSTSNNSNGGGCGCFSLIFFVLLVMFGYYSCVQKSFYGGAAVMKTKYEQLKNNVSNEQSKMQSSTSDTCDVKWVKVNADWIKQCKTEYPKYDFNTFTKYDKGTILQGVTGLLEVYIDKDGNKAIRKYRRYNAEKNLGEDGGAKPTRNEYMLTSLSAAVNTLQDANGKPIVNGKIYTMKGNNKKFKAVIDKDGLTFEYVD